MSRKWAYIFAVVILAFVTVVIYAAVHIPGLQRTGDRDRQALGRLSIVAVKIMPANLAELPIELAYQPATKNSQAQVSYTIESNPEAQAELSQSVKAWLTDDDSEGSQSKGSFVDNGRTYHISITPSPTQAVVTIAEGAEVAN